MLCQLCENFLADLLNRDFARWRHVEPGWYTFKHGNDATIRAAADGGCETCTLFNHTRRRKIRGYDELNEKWLVQASSIDYKYEYDVQKAHTQGSGKPPEERAKATFYLLTVLPEMSWLAFELFDSSLPSKTQSSERGSIGLPLAVASTALSSTALSVSSLWLSECLTSHAHCVKQERASFPTRVLDIRPSGSTLDLRLQVNKGHQGRYVTLSHCWGSQARLTLNKHNLGAFQQQLPFEQLPPTFADAVRLTACLGQRYLWIDALCILQDDDEDWRREAATMCSVFENALFSISALSAQDSHSGLLQDRQFSQTIVESAGSHVGIRERLPSLEEALRQSKLETRAWCLQERLLSPRILHVAPEQLHWECRACLVSETTPGDPRRNDSGEAIRSFTVSNSETVVPEKKDSNHHARWLRLVSGYSSRDLTKSSDRLPAISGLAEKAKRELGLGTYVHGLWLDNLIAGLLWQRQPRRRTNTSERHVENTLPSPGWSWASSSAAVEYPLLEGAFEQRSTKADLVLKRRHPQDTRDKHGSVADALSVIGRIKRGSCKMPATSPKPNEAVFRSSGSLLADEGLTCTLDDGDDPLSRGCYCLFIAMFGKPSRSTANNKEDQRSCYLVLERMQGSGPPQSDTFGSFRRIGMGFDSPRKVDKVFANAERQRLDLV